MSERLKREFNHEAEPTPGPAVQKLIIEYDNGKVSYLEGKAAQKHLKQINDVLSFMQVTRSYMLSKNFLKSPWKEIDVSEAAKLFQQKPEKGK